MYIRDFLQCHELDFYFKWLSLLFWDVKLNNTANFTFIKE